MPIQKRIVVHFSGFEPLSTDDHHSRYMRSAAQSASVWDASFQVGPLDGNRFLVDGEGPGWQTQSTIHILDHNDLIRTIRDCGTMTEIARGFQAFAAAAFREGGLVAYFRAAWRFAGFFVFPFLYMAACLLLALGVGLLPALLGFPLAHLVWSLPLGAILFKGVLLPLMERLHTRALFANWQMAIKVARENDPRFNAWMDAKVDMLAAALSEDADDHVITSHSMGSNLAVQVVGRLLDRDPQAFAGKRVIFATIGGAALQCALMRSAGAMRNRVRLIAECPYVEWIDVQSLTDIINFYKANVPASCGFPELRQPRHIRLRFRDVLTDDHYRRIKRDFLRVHRQYVLGPSRRGNFDFTLFTAGPFAAIEFADFTSERLPDLSRFAGTPTAA